MNKRIFAHRLMDWYAEHKRPLPWRETRDPYKIWLSEIILQQTRVAQGLPYYQRFVSAYPTVNLLAAAPQQSVLRLWQGLGYYTRARNLHACAQRVVHDFGGVFPSTYAQLLKLPGIGPYTAAAIASISFRQPVAVVDGNVFRVLARIFGLEDDIARPGTKEKFSRLANDLLVSEAPDIFNQALMEFGALQCTPKAPDCSACPFSKNCEASQHQRVQDFPVKSKKAPVRHRYFTYLVFAHGKNLLLKPRTGADIWNGLYEFYLIETKAKRSVASAVKTCGLPLGPSSAISKQVSYQHLLSHQRLHIQMVYVELKTKAQAARIQKETGGRFYSLRQVERLPKPIIINRYLHDIKTSAGKKW